MMNANETAQKEQMTIYIHKLQTLNAELLEALEASYKELEFISRKPNGFDYEKHGLLGKIHAVIAKARQ